MALFLFALDRKLPGAGLWLLLGLSLTAGFAHGALDIELLLRRFQPLSSAARLSALYLAVVMLLAWVLSGQPEVALFLLLMMSAWHFGEDYERWSGVSRLTGLLTRLTVGGAPVMVPLIFSPISMIALLDQMDVDAAAAAWWLLSQAWLVLLACWVVVGGLRHARVMRHAWIELAAVVALNLAFSPLMAFALYFGAYHAPLHIWRVLLNRPQADAAPVFGRSGWIAIFIATLILAAMLWWSMGGHSALLADWGFSLRWLVLALTALTLPHLVLVSLCAQALSRPGSTPLPAPGS